MTGVGALAAIILACMKAAEVGVTVDWSWWAVLIPLGIGLAIDALFYVLMFLVAMALD